MIPNPKRGRKWAIYIGLAILLMLVVCMSFGCARRPPTLSELLGEPVAEPDNSNYWK